MDVVFLPTVVIIVMAVLLAYYSLLLAAFFLPLWLVLKLAVKVAGKDVQLARFKRPALWLAQLCLAGTCYYFEFVHNPLPSDAEMIAHFHAHRADFEELVRRYRAYNRPSKRDTSL